jgi:hypothetical protein
MKKEQYGMVSTVLVQVTKWCTGLAVFRANSAHLNIFTIDVFLASVYFTDGARLFMP